MISSTLCTWHTTAQLVRHVQKIVAIRTIWAKLYCYYFDTKQNTHQIRIFMKSNHERKWPSNSQKLGLSDHYLTWTQKMTPHRHSSWPECTELYHVTRQCQLKMGITGHEKVVALIALSSNCGSEAAPKGDEFWWKWNWNVLTCGPLSKYPVSLNGQTKPSGIHYLG